MGLLDRLAIYGVPIFAGLIVAAVLLGPGQERAVAGARVRGVLCRPATRFAFRLETLRHHRGRYEPAPSHALRLELASGGRVVGRWEGASDDAGIAEAAGPLDAELADGARISLWSGEAPLCDAPTRPREALQRIAWASAAERRAAEPVQVDVVLPRQVAVPSFPEPLRIDVIVGAPAGDGRETRAAPPLVRAEMSGGELSPLGDPEQRHLAEVGWSYRYRPTLRVQALAAELTVIATTAAGRVGRWHGPLPVAPGGLWLAPDGLARGRLQVESATPRTEAYLSLLDPSGRVWGAVLPLSPSPPGGARGGVSLPELPSRPWVAVVSSDATESEGATVAWALEPERHTLAPARMEVLVDGMPTAIAAERARVRAVRRPAYGLILAAGLYELLYLLQRNRRSGEALRRRMRKVAAATADAERELDGGDSGAAASLPREAAGAAPTGAIDPSTLGADREPSLEQVTRRLAEGPGLVWLTVLAAGVLLAFLVLAGVAAWG
ncbi:MAG: hypothetical protein JRI23_12770 [Deltaproteobacteria bacterium]|nr:hypothetical protein [Deltaproteobacteria bacterium]MBW2532588.1 hypothetical protein [Deltaproteobacteria bacterium]